MGAKALVDDAYSSGASSAGVFDIFYAVICGRAVYLYLVLVGIST